MSSTNDAAASAELRNADERVADLKRQLAEIQASEAFRIGQVVAPTLVRIRRSIGRRPGRAWMSRLRDRVGTADSPAGGRGKRRADLLIVALASDGALPYDQLATMAEALALTRVVVLTDAPPPPEPLSGFDVELVTPLEDWVAHRPRLEWGPYVARCVAIIADRPPPSRLIRARRRRRQPDLDASAPCLPSPSAASGARSPTPGDKVVACPGVHAAR